MRTTTTVPPTVSKPAARRRYHRMLPLTEWVRSLMPAGALRTMLIGAALVIGGVTAQDEGPLPVKTKAEAPTSGSALRVAKALLSKVRGLDGDAKVAALDRAAVAYGAVIQRFADDKSACARAWFEVGEIHRRKGNLGEAEPAYQRAVELDAARFGERAGLQRGHMQRRLERIDEALVTYRRVAKIKPKSARAHQARSWIGRCLQAQGDLNGAVVAYQQAIEVTAKPRRIIDLCNRLAKAELARGNLEAAGAAIARAEKAVPAGETPDAKRLRKAFGAMSARRALQRARDKMNGAHRDAIELSEQQKAAGS